MRPAGQVGILADDLIWGTRLADQARRADAAPVPLRDLAGLRAALERSPTLSGVVVDLTSRAYDGIEACRLAAASGVPVLVVAQHDDRAARQAAMEAGAQRVVAYRTMAEHGPDVLSRLLATGRSAGRPQSGGAQEDR